MKIEYAVDAADLTVRQWIKHKFPHITYDCLQQSLRKGDIKINDQKVIPQFILNINDKCKIWDKLTVIDDKPVKISDKFWRNIGLIAQNKEFWVIDKPYGVPSQGGNNIKVSIVEIMTEWMQAKPYIVHRLDRCTTGLMVIATNSYAARDLSKSLQSRAWHKSYIAKIDGIPHEEFGTISDPIDGKEAITKFRLIKKLDMQSIVRFEPITGRKHQIRKHAAKFLHAVSGDELYGSCAKGNMCLRCCEIEFEFRGDKYEYKVPALV